jgi:ParB-like chromosome segregation protein Spo0J
MPIDSLRPADSPRLSGEDVEHIRLLAESEATLPPIIVHRSSLRVIDGTHRLRAAMLRKQHDIDVLFFDGNEKEAFVLAVKANVAHGLPLSLADRTAAARRIVHTHFQWSDRMIAKVAGLSPKTVAAIRLRCSTVDTPQLNSRIGNDGRTRPINSTQARKVASKFIADNPDATLREIAKAASISPATARNVRNKMRQAESATPPNQKWRENRPKNDNAQQNSFVRHPLAKPAKAILLNLKKDPSLRFTEAGRTLLRLLDANTIEPEGWLRLIDNVPVHCAGLVADIARQSAAAWHYVAQQAERRAHASAKRLSGLR